MRRRAVLAGLGGSALTWPCAARAQAARPRTIGVLSGEAAQRWEPYVAAFKRGLAAEGFVDGRNIAIEFRWADHRRERLPALAADLVRREVDVIAAFGPPAALAAKAATSTIPIVFTLGSDPLRHGLVSSLGRPEGNVTGATFLTIPLGAKRVDLMLELVPKAAALGFLLNPNSPSAGQQLVQMQEVTGTLRQKWHVARARTQREIENAFASLARRKVDALIVWADLLFNSRRRLIVELAARVRIPAMYEIREYVEAGGLVSYGARITETYRQAGAYAGRILEGARPADLPVLLPTRFELVVNLHTASALGLTLPDSILLRADEVIE